METIPTLARRAETRENAEGRWQGRTLDTPVSAGRELPNPYEVNYHVRQRITRGLFRPTEVAHTVHLNFEEVLKIQHQVQRVSHSVTFNQDGSFTCRRHYDPFSTPDQFAVDIRKIMMAARRGKIEILEKTTEYVGRKVSYFVVRFKPLR